MLRTVRLTIVAILANLLHIGSMPAQEDEVLVPEERTENGVQYRSGGIGQSERAAMLALQKDYNLMVMFLERGTRKAISDATVVIRSKKDIVLQAISEGPIFYAQLPNGRYTLTAEVDGTAVARSFNVSGKNRSKLLLRWQPSTEEDPAPEAWIGR